MTAASYLRPRPRSVKGRSFFSDVPKLHLERLQPCVAPSGENSPVSSQSPSPVSFIVYLMFPPGNCRPHCQPPSMGFISATALRPSLVAVIPTCTKPPIHEITKSTSSLPCVPPPGPAGRAKGRSVGARDHDIANSVSRAEWQVDSAAVNRRATNQAGGGWRPRSAHGDHV